MNLPASNSVIAVATNLVVEMRVYSPFTPVSVPNAIFTPAG